MRLSLSEWETFYVITGSSAAALTGIMFVVIALVADRVKQRPSGGMSAFSTPTVGHFAIVLLLASVMTIPRHSLLTLGLCIGGCALAGLTSTGIAGMHMGRVKGYRPATEDWLWHVIIPFASYAVLLVCPFLLGGAQELALVMTAGVVLALIFIGIHNAWDVAVFIVTQHVPEVGADDTNAATATPNTEAVATPVAARSDAT